MASPPLRKRPRNDNESGQEELLRDTQFWFQDGSIVVVAQQSAFRVHQGVLSRHSDTFNGLFTIPQPSEGTEKIDGCPVVRVSDSAHDFKHLLHALYDGLNMFAPGKIVRFACAAALARLGHKYELEQVLQAALSRLRIVYTTDLATWRQALGPKKQPEFSCSSSNCFEAVNLFRTIGCTEMLPVALYFCAVLPNAYLIKGSHRADGTPETLSPEDLERCLNARDCFTKRGTHFFYTRHGAEASPLCTSRCHSVLDDRRARVALPTFEGVLVRHVLHGVGRTLMDSVTRNNAVCPLCIEHLANIQDAFEKEMWLALPKMLNLHVEGWPTTV